MACHRTISSVACLASSGTFQFTHFRNLVKACKRHAVFDRRVEKLVRIGDEGQWRVMRGAEAELAWGKS